MLMFAEIGSRIAENGRFGKPVMSFASTFRRSKASLSTVLRATNVSVFGSVMSSA